MRKYRTKQGFTIIEVVLVLAIAGLIFLMVFVAFPALQRNQRDAQRRQDMAYVTANLKNTTANGLVLPEKLPAAARANCLPAYAATIASLREKRSILSCKLLLEYFNSETNLDGENQFRDPDGKPYALFIRNGMAGDNVNYTTMKGAYGWEDNGANNHYIVVTLKTECSSDNDAIAKMKSNDNPNSFTVRYAMEGGDIYCQNGSL